MPGSPAEAGLRLLTFSNLFPNAEQPRHGIFVAERLRQMRATDRVDAQVIAPVPWFPSRLSVFGRYAEAARVPHREQVAGFDVRHPRFASIPKVGMSIAPLLMASSVAGCVSRLSVRADLIDAHFLYPDGVAAAILARRLGLPVVLTARGSDVNQFANFSVPRRWLRWCLSRADHVFAVSSALRNRLLELGAPAERLSVAINGVDLEKFSPRPRGDMRRRLEMPGDSPVLLAVGNLLELKGHHLMIDAVARLPDAHLWILGEGPRRAALEAQVRQLGLGDRVHLPGNVAQDELADYYSAADATLLASSREGMPNVVLESLACATPVVANAVGGVPEVVSEPLAGELLSARSAEMLLSGIHAVLERDTDRDALRSYAGRFAWAPIVNRQIDIMARLTRNHESETQGSIA